MRNAKIQNIQVSPYSVFFDFWNNVDMLEKSRDSVRKVPGNGWGLQSSARIHYRGKSKFRLRLVTVNCKAADKFLLDEVFILTFVLNSISIRFSNSYQVCKRLVQYKEKYNFYKNQLFQVCVNLDLK